MINKIVVVVSILLFTISVSAQPRGDNSKYDPNVNPYEKLLKDTARGKRTARFLMNLIEPVVARDYFQSSPCNDYAELSNVRIKQFQEFVQEFLNGTSDPKQMKTAEVKYQKAGTAKIIEAIDYHIGYLEKQGTYTSNGNEPLENLLCRAKGSIQAIKSTHAYLTALKKVFPSLTGMDEGIAKAQEVITKYGDNKSLLALIKGNKNEVLADVFMPAAVTKNTEWEAWFKTYFTKNYPGYTIIRQSLLTANWYIRKNEISGLPEYRQIGTAIGAKAPDGKCKIIKIDLYQDYLGGKFEPNSRFQKFDEKEILCENLK